MDAQRSNTPLDVTPSVTGVSPNVGPSGGGTDVVIGGSGFTDSMDVFFGGTDESACPSGGPACFNFVSDTEIDAQTPAASSGTVHITVMNPAGTSAPSSADQFTFFDPPTVTNVTPPSGPTTGGNSVVVAGTNFNGTTDVFVDTTDISNTCPGTPCYTVDSDTQITVNNFPAHATGTVDITVQTPGGTSGTSSNDQYTYVVLPTVTGVSPASGPTAGGNSVTVSGSQFTGATDVFVGAFDVTNVCGSSPCYTVNSGSSITLDLPPHSAGTVDIRVETPGGESDVTSNDQYTFLTQPTVTNVTPPSGPTAGGNSVTLAGTAFTGATDVFVGAFDVTNVCGSAPCYVVNGPTSITVTMPSQGAGTVDIRVETAGGESVINSNDEYVYVAPPTVSGVAPSSGPSSGGNQIGITGTLFTGATDVFVGGFDVTNVCGSAPCYTVNSATLITVTMPAHAAGTVDIRVETAGGESVINSNDQYTFVAAPTVTNVAPDAGPVTGGNAVVVTGTGFTGATDVFVDTTDVGGSCPPAPCFIVNSPTQITVEVPSHAAANNIDITVQGVGGTSATSSNDQYSYVPIPTVTNVSPAIGPLGGGNTVTISGTAFESGSNWNASSVSVGSSVTTQCPGGAGAPCFTVNTPTSITVSNVPGHAAGTIDVTVTTPGGTSATTVNDEYTYAALPTVTAVSPPAGPAGGVTSSVTITGTAFEQSGSFTTSDVFFGAVDITSPCPGPPNAPCFTVNSPTQIVAQDIQPHAAATVDITVQTPLGTSAPSPPGDTFAWAPVPTVTNVSPNNGATSGGIAVTVTGTGFESGTNYTASSVQIGGTPCAPTSCFVVNSPTQLTITSISGGSGQVDITVTNLAGTSATTPNDIFTYVPNLPTVSSLSPSTGATSGLAIVTITGANYGSLGSGFNPTSVRFGSLPPITTTPCPSSSPTSPCFTRLDADRISVATPASSTAGPVNVTVTTGAGTSNNLVAYTYIAPGAYTALKPYRICDTRSTGTKVGCAASRTLGPNGTVVVHITGTVVGGESVPAGAQAVVVNLTAIDYSKAGSFVTAYPATRPTASNINVDGGHVQANLAVVALSSTGTITVYNALGSVDVLVDVQGYFAAPAGNAGTFHTFPPVRICDTRANMHTVCATTANRPLAGGTWRDVVVSGLPPGGSGSGIPGDGTAAAAVLNITAVSPSAATFLAVAPATGNFQCPTGSPSASNLNPRAGESEPNRVITPLGLHQDICVFNAVGSANFIVDVNGWFGTGAESTPGAHFYAVPPTRICDTRPNTGTRCANPLTNNSTRLVVAAGVLVVPAFTTTTPPVGIVANLTGVSGSAATFFLLYPSDAARRPGSSDLNPAAHDVIANLAIVSLATTGGTAGDVDLYNAVGTINAIIDVAGWFQ